MGEARWGRFVYEEKENVPCSPASMIEMEMPAKYLCVRKSTLFVRFHQTRKTL